MHRWCQNLMRITMYAQDKVFCASVLDQSEPSYCNISTILWITVIALISSCPHHYDYILHMPCIVSRSVDIYTTQHLTIWYTIRNVFSKTFWDCETRVKKEPETLIQLKWYRDSQDQGFFQNSRLWDVPFKIRDSAIWVKFGETILKNFRDHSPPLPYNHWVKACYTLWFKCKYKQKAKKKTKEWIQVCDIRHAWSMKHKTSYSEATPTKATQKQNNTVHCPNCKPLWLKTLCTKYPISVLQQINDYLKNSCLNVEICKDKETNKEKHLSFVFKSLSIFVRACL